MTQKILATPNANLIELTPQDVSSGINWHRVFSIALSLAVIAAAFTQIRMVDPAQIWSLVPVSPLFWSLFVIGFLAGPLSEWFIFNRLWGVGLPSFGALTRKLAYNELVLGYLGEAWFYAWARKNAQISGSPFGAVKDVAVLSAMAGNVMTLVLIIAALPYLDLLPLGDYGSAIGWSLAFVLATTLAAMIWRRALFSLARSELVMVFGVHVGRIIVTTIISAILWQMILPDTHFGWWLVLAAIRLLISRLPFIPNKDIAFAGVAVIVASSDTQIASLLTLMAGLILMANLVVGLSFSAFDLIKGDRRDVVAR